MADDYPKKMRIFYEIVMVLLVLLVVRELFRFVSEHYAGPISTLMALLTATILIVSHGKSWRDMGLYWNRGAIKLFIACILLFITLIVIAVPLTSLAELYFERVDETNRFGELYGNLEKLIWYAALSVLVGGFAEEMVYRGFLLPRLADLLGNKRRGMILAVLLTSAFFGLRHALWQGGVGAVSAFAVALVFGTAYFVMKRNLWPLIIVHSAVDVISFIEDYYGV